MIRRLLPLALAAGFAAPAFAERPEPSAVSAGAVLAEAKGTEVQTKVLNGGLVRQVCALRGTADGRCVYQCRDGNPLRTPQPAGECPRTVLQDEGSEKGFDVRGPWDRPGRGPWNRPGPGDRRPPWPGEDRPVGRSAIECSASDHGWEEHWGGHVSRGWDLYNSADAACRACKAPTGPHGDCSVSCAEPEYACAYEFLPDGGGNAQPGGWGEPRVDSYRAEEAAMDRCRRDNWGRQGRCRVSQCQRQDRVLLRNRCR